MAIRDQVDTLEKRVAELKTDFQSAQKESSEQVHARMDKAKAVASEKRTETKSKADNAKQRQASQWKALKDNASARFEKIQADMENKQRNIDAKTANVAAQWAEEDAMDALEYAAWVVDQANLAVLDAVDARARANAR